MSLMISVFDGCKRDQKSEGAHVSNGQNDENEIEGVKCLQRRCGGAKMVTTMCSTYAATSTASNGREGDFAHDMYRINGRPERPSPITNILCRPSPNCNM
eukprot:scaffold1350_cov137-Skeletonema_dohrnii-CCMP3373.AAC.15